MPGDEPHAALESEVGTRAIALRRSGCDDQPVAEADQEVDVGGLPQIHQTIHPLSRRRPNAMTAALRPTVASLPRFR